jgi:sialic acid synthase SpsE
LDGVLNAKWVIESDGGFAWDGFSDHTRTVWTGACAAAMGAQIIEVHVRAYDTSPMNLDYATALDPREFRLYAEGVRTAERLIADVPVDESAMRQFKVRV